MFHKTLSSNSKMLKSIFGALSGEYKMHTIGESTLDSLPGTETVQFYSQNIPINITLKSSSEFKTLKVAYKVSSNDKSKTLPNIKSIINEENVREIHFMEGKNQHKSGLMISVGNINYLPLLVDAIVFIPDNLISKFKLKIVTQSGTLNTNSLSIESLDSEYSSSISYNDINVHTLRIKSITGDINLRGCTFVNALLNSEKGCVKFNRCKYFNIYSMAHKDIIISSTRGSLLKLYSKEGSIDLSTSRCDDATINHNCPKRIKIVDFTFINLTISSSFADINLVGCKLDLLKVLTKNGPLNITDCAIDVASIKSLDGPVKVLDSKCSMMEIISENSSIRALDSHADTFIITSDSGEIELKGIRSTNAVRLHSDTGNIRLEGRFTSHNWTHFQLASIHSAALSGMTMHGNEEDVKLIGVVSARTLTGTISCSMHNFEVLDIYSEKGDISLDGTRKAISVRQQAVLKSRGGNIDVKTDSFDGLLESRTLHGECTVDVSDGNTYKLDSTFQSKRYEFKAGKSSQHLQTFVEYGTSRVIIE